MILKLVSGWQLIGIKKIYKLKRGIKMVHYWDWNSFFLYLLVGIHLIFWSVCLRNNQKSNNLRIKSKVMLCQLCFLIFPFLVAAFRLITPEGIGGSDIIAYQQIFEDSNQLNISLIRVLLLKETEPLYKVLNFVVRKYTDNFRYLLIIHHAIILYCMMKFIQKFFNKYCYSGILILTVIPFVYSFSAMRSSLAVFISLLAFTYYNKNRKIAFLLVVISVLFHFTALILIPFFVLDWFFNIKMKQRKTWLLILTSIASVVAYIALNIGKSFLATTKYRPYLLQSMSIRGQLIIILLFVLCIIFYKDMAYTKENRLLLNLIFYNVMILPFVLLAGAYRLNEFFVFPRIFMWGILTVTIKRKYFPLIRDRYLINIMATFCIIAWFMLRLYRMISAGIMPYHFIIN